MEPDHIEPIKCPCCKAEIANYQQDCKTCICGAVTCPNCGLTIPIEILKMAVIY